MAVNEAKSQVLLPGEPTEYLYLRYQRGAVDLSDHARYKVQFTSSAPRALAGHVAAP